MDRRASAVRSGTARSQERPPRRGSPSARLRGTPRCKDRAPRASLDRACSPPARPEDSGSSHSCGVLHREASEMLLHTSVPDYDGRTWAFTRLKSLTEIPRRLETLSKSTCTTCKVEHLAESRRGGGHTRSKTEEPPHAGSIRHCWTPPTSSHALFARRWSSLSLPSRKTQNGEQLLVPSWCRWQALAPLRYASSPKCPRSSEACLR